MVKQVLVAVTTAVALAMPGAGMASANTVEAQQDCPICSLCIGGGQLPRHCMWETLIRIEQR